MQRRGRLHADGYVPVGNLRGLDVAPDGRSIKRHGLREVDEYELEVPTWQRRQQSPPVAVAERAPARRSNGFDTDEADFDIPTFLRRSAE